MAYIPTIWESGDIVTSEKLNKLENGVEGASITELPVVTSSDNGNVLTVVGGKWAKAAPKSAFFIVNADTDANDNVTLDKTLALIIAAYQGGLMPIMVMHSYGIGEGNISDTMLFLTGITVYQGALSVNNGASFSSMASVDPSDGVNRVLVEITPGDPDDTINVTVGQYPDSGD